MDGNIVYEGEGVKKEFKNHEKIREAISKMRKNFRNFSVTEPIELSL